MKNQFLARASMIGNLMANDRTGKNIGETAMKEIQKIVLFDKYGIETDISSKYIDKGIQNEKIGVQMAIDVLDWFDVDVNKPKIRYTNEWITGEPDVDSNMICGDIKCSFDGTTFPWFATECPNKIYFYQMQSYMWLMERDHSFLVYTLTNHPDQMLLDETNRATWRALSNPKYESLSQSEIEQIMEQQMRSQFTFDHIPLEKRVKPFRIDRDDNVINAMKTRIEIIREIYSNFYKSI